MPQATVNGVKINYEDRGSGEPVVLVHGAATASGMFGPLADVLEDSYRLIIPDLRGMGQSERVKAIPPDAWVRDLDGLLDVLGLDAVHLIGCSLGARVVGRYALEYPQRSLSVVPDAPIIAMETASNNALNAHLNLAEVSDDSPSAQNWRQMHGEDWRDVVASYFEIRNDGALQDYLSVRPQVAQTTTPTLVTRGDQDEPVHPLAHAIEWHALVPGSWLWIAPNVGPSAVMGAPAEFKAIYATFLASLKEKASA